MISYDPLWKTMKEKSVTKYTLEKLCKVLECTPNEIVEFVED